MILRSVKPIGVLVTTLQEVYLLLIKIQDVLYLANKLFGNPGSPRLATALSRAISLVGDRKELASGF